MIPIWKRFNTREKPFMALREYRNQLSARHTELKSSHSLILKSDVEFEVSFILLVMRLYIFVLLLQTI